MPGTIALRNACLGIGALLSIYPIYASRHLFFQKRALPIWLVVMLLGWVTFHLLFLSQDPQSQLGEFYGIWKRVTLGIIFALGMGISIARLNSIHEQSKRHIRWAKVCWIIFYLGLLLPTMIYLLKFLLVLYGPKWAVVIPGFLQMYVGVGALYIAKTAYVAFCLPVFAIALGALFLNIKTHRWLSFGNLFYLPTLPAVFFIFYSENIKNGVAYGLLLILIFLFLLVRSLLQGRWLQKILLTILLLTSALFFLATHLEQNQSWRSFAADARVALNTSQNTQWKYNGEKGYPINGDGAPVSVTNYERIAWAKEGIRLISENPLGYGLVERSFGHLAKLRWPDSKLHQSHSGWIDLTLGIGIPGVALLLGSILILINQLRRSSTNFELSRWVIAYRWTLLCLLLMWCTTEISQKVYLDELLFWIAFAAGINLAPCDPTDDQVPPKISPLSPIGQGSRGISY